ncbi:MAG: hypothetical protein BIP78_1429 [Candidatus Bipolaricaulis sibiricus]|uniref:Uncharacterized protein n=1 Tax=Bipolaricaulis sibiricus TaxID=2501609 RepID=A0A410FVR0_BIPS1|nr:MAG: hypothetical protein BIP78_1429 [Candidatus Bipolaricaulis sibiricus]
MPYEVRLAKGAERVRSRSGILDHPWRLPVSRGSAPGAGLGETGLPW